MKALITGASGFLGDCIAEALVSAGHSARALVPRTSRAESLERLGVEIARGDLRDAGSPRSRVFDGIEVVIHAAIPQRGDRREDGDAAAAATRALLAAAEEAAVRRFVHISSIEVYAVREPPAHGAAALIVEDAPLEQDRRHLTDSLSSCIESESAATEFGRRGKMHVLVLRAGILYGPGGDWRLPRMGYPLGRSAYALIGRGRNPLPVCYVENCARAALLAAENSSVTEGAFNIVDDELFTPMEFLERLREEARPNLRILRFPRAPADGLAAIGEAIGKRMEQHSPGGPPAWWPVRGVHGRARYSNEAAKKALGWRPGVGKEEALARTMRSFSQAERVSRRADLAVLRGAGPRPQAGPVTVCIIGCGKIAAEHLAILGDLDDVKARGVCDVNPEAARTTAHEYMILRAYADAEEMLRKEKPQAVHILTPPDSHAALTELAAKYGCHVFVETPMALSAGEAARMIAAAREHRVALCVGHSLLYEPVMVQARRLMEQGELGEVVWVESYYGLDLRSDPASRYLAGGSRKHWAFQLPGGVCQELAPHPLSLALDVLGAAARPERGVPASAAPGPGGAALPGSAFKPLRVTPYAGYGGRGVGADTDDLRVFLETPRAGGVAAVSLAASPRFVHLNIFGTKMTLFVDLLNQCLVPQRAGRRRPGGPSPLSRAAMNFGRGAAILRGALDGALRILQKTWSDYDGMELLVREFYASLRENRPPPVTGEEGLRVMEVMDEIWACPPAAGESQTPPGRSGNAEGKPNAGI